MTTKPRALRPGDRLGLAAPSGGLKDPAQADRAAEALHRLGFEVEIAEGCRHGYGYLAGSDERRAADLNAFFADDAIAGIVCLKGGYGTPRILDAIDYGLVARRPKVFVGYSDITAIHLALHRRCSLATFHGPMGVSDVLLEGEEYSTRSWLDALTRAEPLGRVENPPGTAGMKTLVPGKARGELLGGNLSLVAGTIGTPYAIDARGKILFLEDIGERPYRVDRMLTQLRLAGVFEDCAGVVLGDWNDCGPEEGKASLELEQVFRDVIAPAGKPTVFGLKAGHCNPTATLPFGVTAELDADEPGLRFTESALSGGVD